MRQSRQLKGYLPVLILEFQLSIILRVYLVNVIHDVEKGIGAVLDE